MTSLASALRAVTLEQVEGELLSRSLREYVPAAWPHVQPDPFVPGWHIDAICEHLQAVSEGKIKRLIISVPPRHGKSTVASVLWPTWQWCRRPSTRFVYGSYALDLATRDAVYSRRLLDSRWYTERWGCACPEAQHVAGCYGFRLTSDQNVKTLYENDRSGRRLTASVRAGTTGEGGDILTLDDALDILEADSPEARAHAWDYTERVWMRRVNDPAKSALVAIAQRTHQEDVTGHLLAQTGWDHLCLPTEYEIPPQVQMTSIGFEDPRTEEGELLWPARYGPASVEQDKLNPWAFAAQNQQRPSPASGGLLKREWWRMWKPRGSDLEPVRDPETGHVYATVELPRTFDQQIQSWDTSFKGIAQAVRKGRQPDPVSGGAWGRKGPDCYLLDRVNRRMDVVEASLEVLDMSARFPGAVEKLIENKANGPAIMALLRHKVAGLVAVDPWGGKEQRVRNAAPTEIAKDARALSMIALVKGGNVILPHPQIAPWVWEYIAELAAFPQGAHDDDVDMTSQALTHLQPWVWRAEEEAKEAVELAKPVDLLAEHVKKLHESTRKMLREREEDDRDARLRDDGPGGLPF